MSNPPAPTGATRPTVKEALILLINHWSPHNQDKAMDIMRAELARGASPDECFQDNDLSALATLAKHYSGNYTYTGAASIRGISRLEGIFDGIKLLVEAGASPLERSRDVIKAGSIMFFMKAAPYFAERENDGHPMRDRDGQCLLHHLAKAEKIPFASSNPALTSLYHPDWINAQDHLGNTPLHLLWNAADHYISLPETDSMGGISHGAIVMKRMGMETVWSNSQLLTQLGAQLSIKNHQNQSVADLISQRIDEGFQVLSKGHSIWPQVQATLLDQQTAAAQRAAKPLPRL